MCTLCVYKLFELFARRKERLNIIDKLGDKLDPSALDISGKIRFSGIETGNTKFGTLKFACLLLGIGLGLLVGFFIENYYVSASDINSYDTKSVIYGASVLFFGGLGLLISFLVELKYNKKDK
jgi:hypothetical protein